jgi:hypothetical protein
MDQEAKHITPSATRRNVLLGLVAGAGVTAAVASSAQAQSKPVEKPAGPVLFRRTAETERYYKTLLNK